MQLKIHSGTALVKSLAPADPRATIVEGADLRIECSAPPVATVPVNGGTLYLFGMVVGRRGADGRLVPVPDLAAALRALAAQGNLAEALADGLEGRFVAVAVAGSTARVFRDSFAKIDLFHAEADGGIAMATDLDGMPSNPGDGGYDQAALAHMLSYYGHRPPKRHTLYSSVRRLGVGDTAELAGGKLRIERRPFMPTASAAYGEADLNDYVDLFLGHLEAAGSRDGNVVYLSSGWDSTSILAGLVHVFGKDKVRAVTGRMTYSERSGVCNRFEMDRAAKFAEYYGIRLDIAPFDYAKNAASWVEQAKPIFKRNQFYSHTGLNHLVLADKTAETASGDEAVFAGEISDGAHNLGFSQYATVFHPSYEFREYADKMASYLFGPTHLKEILAGRQDADAVARFFRAGSGGAVFETPAADPAGRMRQFMISFFLRNGRRPFWSIKNQSLLTAEGAAAYTETMADAYLAEAFSATPEALYSWYLHLYNSFHWQGSTVATLAVMAESKGLRANLPFWDAGLQKWLSAMPENFGRGLDFNPTKYPLKWMLANRVDYPMALQVGPHSYTYDVDPGFSHFQELLCHSSYGMIVRERLKAKPYHAIMSADVFNLAYMDGIVDRYLGGEQIAGAELSDLVSISLLCVTGWH